MKNINYIVIGVLLLIGWSCTKDFENINSNPNAPIEVQPAFLFRQVIYDYGEQMSYEGFVAGNLLGQYFTAVDFNLFDRHSLSEPQFGGNPWPILYQNLRDNEIILKRAQEGSISGVYEGPALIMKAYLTAALTDIFGDVPYSEALNGKDGIITPKYDEQEMIYTGANGILDNLRTGIQKIQTFDGLTKLDGDVLFEGDLERWVKFANSLLIKNLVRISAKAEVATELTAIYESGNYIQSAEDDAAFDFSNSPPNNFRLSTARIGDFNIYVMSETIDEILENYNDPRAAVFFRPAGNNGEFEGLLNGPDASQTSISVADFSLSGEIFRESTGDLDANFLTSWEIKFLLAEAALKNYINADPQALYEQGVTEAFTYWQTELPDNYLTSGATAYGNNGADPLAQIITQKWLANIVNGFEGWIEYRRTGFPEFKTIAASLNNDLIPERMPYPIDEEALNGENFQRAAAATDGNSINAKVWWNR